MRVDHAVVAAAAAPFHPRELVLDDLLRVELREERLRLAQRLPGLELARLPAPRPRVVVAGEHEVVLAVLLGDLARIERPRDDVLVAEQLVQRLRA